MSQEDQIEIYASQLESARSPKRHDVYSRFLSHATASPGNLIEMLQGLNTPENYWASQLKEKLTPEQIRRRFGKGAQPTVADFQTIINTLGSEHDPSLLQAFEGYLDQSFLRLTKTKPNNIDAFIPVVEQAIAVETAFALAALSTTDTTKLHTIMQYRRDALSDPYSATQVLQLMLSFSEKEAGVPQDIATEAGMITLLVDSLDYAMNGAPMLDQKTLDTILDRSPGVAQLKTVLERIRSGQVRKPVPSDSKAERIDSLIKELVEKPHPVSSVTIIPERSVVADLATQMYVNNQVTNNNNYYGPDGPQTSFLHLPGGYKMVLFVQPETPLEVAHNHVKTVLAQRIATITKAPHAEMQKTALAEMENVFFFNAPEYDADLLQERLNEEKNRCISGLYTLSRRGDCVEVTDEVSSNVGIADIVFKRSKRATHVDIHILGTTVPLIIDKNMEIDFCDATLSPRMQDWLSLIVFTYLGKIRQGENEKKSETAKASSQPTSRGDAPVNTKPTVGNRPHLRVLPLGHTPQETRTLITDEGEQEVDINELTEHAFGYPLSIIQSRFACAHIHPDINEALPTGLKGLVNGLIDNLKTKAVQPVWVDEWIDDTGRVVRTPNMTLANPPASPHYDPISSFFYVTFVQDSSDEQGEPKQIKFKAISFQDVMV